MFPYFSSSTYSDLVTGWNLILPTSSRTVFFAQIAQDNTNKTDHVYLSCGGVEFLDSHATDFVWADMNMPCTGAITAYVSSSVANSSVNLSYVNFDYTQRNYDLSVSSSPNWPSVANDFQLANIFLMILVGIGILDFIRRVIIPEKPHR